METSIHLDQLAKVLSPLSPLSMRPSLSRPAPQRLVIDNESILGRQVLGCQRWSKPFALFSRIFGPHLLQHLVPKLLRLGAIRNLARAAVFQPSRPLLPIPPPKSLRVPITHLQQRSRVSQSQFFTFYSCQNFHSAQLAAAHRCSPQSDPSPIFRGRIS